MEKTDYQDLAQRTADLFAELPEVEAVALGGSLAGRQTADGHTDAASDIDLYIFTRAEVPLAAREQIVERAGGASRADLGLEYWGSGDEWFDAESGIEMDIIYFGADWMDEQVRRVMLAHQPSLGYSTCLPFTVNQAYLYHDPNRWLAGLQEISRQPYPEPLRRHIIQHNHPVLREIIPSFAFQLEKAVKRGDLVSVNHRLAGLLASFFDILFAFNRELHPGEKKMLEKTLAACQSLPENMGEELNAVLRTACAADQAFLAHLNNLLDHLDQFLGPMLLEA